MDKKNKIYIKKDIAEFHIPRWEEIPNIDLYLDQTVTLLETYLKNYLDNKNEKIITKTMINNYVKQHLIDPPVNKKYNKEHIARLFTICILKQVYSITDISQLINHSFKKYEFKVSYNKFCEELEKAIATIFRGDEYIKSNIGDKEIYLLQNIVLSFANKLYVKRTFFDDDNKKIEKKKDDNKKIEKKKKE